jgi:hypothetical protein
MPIEGVIDTETGKALAVFCAGQAGAPRSWMLQTMLQPCVIVCNIRPLAFPGLK